MKPKATKKSDTTKKFSIKKITNYISSHKILSIAVFLLIAILTTAGIMQSNGTLANMNLLGEDTTETAITQQLELVNNTEELAKLSISQEAINNSDSIKTTSGKCANDMMYNNDENGNFSVASRLSDGSWRCVTYNLKDLQDYESADGSVSFSTNADTGQSTTIVKSTDETGATTTTTTVMNADGSGQSSTEGGYGKMTVGPTNDGREIYAYFDYTDNRYYTDVGRFMMCFMAQNFYTHTNGNNYFDGTYRELSATEKATQASQNDCSRLPELRYESANYNLSSLKSCLRNDASSPDFDTANCYRQAGN